MHKKEEVVFLYNVTFVEQRVYSVCFLCTVYEYKKNYEWIISRIYILAN